MKLALLLFLCWGVTIFASEQITSLRRKTGFLQTKYKDPKEATCESIGNDLVRISDPREQKSKLDYEIFDAISLIFTNQNQEEQEAYLKDYATFCTSKPGTKIPGEVDAARKFIHKVLIRTIQTWKEQKPKKFQGLESVALNALVSEAGQILAQIPEPAAGRIALAKVDSAGQGNVLVGIENLSIDDVRLAIDDLQTMGILNWKNHGLTYHVYPHLIGRHSEMAVTNEIERQKEYDFVDWNLRGKKIVIGTSGGTCPKCRAAFDVMSKRCPDCYSYVFFDNGDDKELVPWESPLVKTGRWGRTAKMIEQQPWLGKCQIALQQYCDDINPFLKIFEQYVDGDDQDEDENSCPLEKKLHEMVAQAENLVQDKEAF